MLNWELETCEAIGMITVRNNCEKYFFYSKTLTIIGSVAFFFPVFSFPSIISPPRDNKFFNKHVSSEIIDPPGEEQASESYEARERRLIDKDIIPKPLKPPEKKPRTFLSILTGDLAPEIKKEQSDQLKNPQFFFQFQVGPWYTLSPMDSTEIMEDMSYSVRAYARVDSAPEAKFFHFLGAVYETYSRGQVMKVKEPHLISCSISRDIAASELGIGYLLLTDTSISQSSQLTYGFEADFLPMKWTTVSSNGQKNLPFSMPQEGSSRFMINYLGFGLEGFIGLTYLRILSIGLYASIHTSTPFSQRVSYGITFSLMTTRNENEKGGR